jgi:hypothetical protein
MTTKHNVKGESGVKLDEKLAFGWRERTVDLVPFPHILFFLFSKILCPFLVPQLLQYSIIIILLSPRI